MPGPGKIDYFCRVLRQTNQTIRRIQGSLVIAVLVFLGWARFHKNKAPIVNKPELVVIYGGDTTRIDVSGWDSTKYDSLARTFSKLSKADDSLNAVYTAKYGAKYGWNALDSMMKSPVPSVVDSFLRELKNRGIAK